MPAFNYESDPDFFNPAYEDEDDYEETYPFEEADEEE
jgi:hypothetical protein